MDILISGGSVVDGTGAPAFRADILVSNGKIKEIAPRITAPCASVVDASGKVVTPGFIDIHRHCDVAILSHKNIWDTMLSQGITTAVVGNCGMSPAPRSPEYSAQMREYASPVLGAFGDEVPMGFPEYMDALGKCTLPVNIAAMVGTGTVRTAVKGFSSGRFTEGEMRLAEKLVASAMDCGAVGASLGIMYLPECWTESAEYARLLRPVGEKDRVAAMHIRGEGDSLLKSVIEAINIGKKSSCPVEISHFKSCGPKNWHRDIYRAIELIESARSAGQDVACDFYPYDGGATTLMSMVPPEFIGGNVQAALDKLGTRAGVERYRSLGSVLYNDWDNYCVLLGWDRIIISAVTLEETLRFVGKTIAQAASEFGFDDGFSLAAHLLSSERGQVSIVNMSMSMEDVYTVAALPYSIVASDSIYGGARHPRIFGTFPKIIREFVHEKHILTLPEAVRKMTALPAARMGFSSRGIIKSGYCADINIFSPDEFSDTASYASPCGIAKGLSNCIIGGKIAFTDGTKSCENAGVLLRS